jgi:hypothetical protein
MAKINDNKINRITYTSTKIKVCKTEGVKRILQNFELRIP